MSTLKEETLQLHEVHRGKLAVSLKVDIETKHDLSLAYTPGGSGAVPGDRTGSGAGIPIYGQGKRCGHRHRRNGGAGSGGYRAGGGSAGDGGEGVSL